MSAPLARARRAGTTLAAPESHAQTRAQQDRNALIDRALNTPRSARSRWVPLGMSAGAAQWAQQPFGPPPPFSEAEGESAAAVPPSPPAAAARGAAAQLAAAAEQAGLVEEESSASASSSALERYQPLLARPTALPSEAVAAAAIVPGAVTPTAWQHEVEAAGQAGEEDEDEDEAQQQQQQAQQVAGTPTSAPNLGPPNLGMLSSEPTIPMDRYVAVLTRPSLEQPSLAAAPSGRASSGEAEQFSAARGSAPATPPGASAAASASPQPQQRHWDPDVVRSDLTATPSLDLSRYAAAFATDAGDASPRLSARPPRPPRGGPHAAFPAVLEQASDEMLPPRDREASWHKSRSLAALQSIFQHPEEQAGEPAGGLPSSPPR